MRKGIGGSKPRNNPLLQFLSFFASFWLSIHCIYFRSLSMQIFTPNTELNSWWQS